MLCLVAPKPDDVGRQHSRKCTCRLAQRPVERGAVRPEFTLHVLKALHSISWAWARVP